MLLRNHWCPFVIKLFIKSSIVQFKWNNYAVYTGLPFPSSTQLFLSRHARQNRVPGVPSLRRRRNLTWVSNVCEAALISLSWAPSGLNQLPESRLEFPFVLICKSTMAFLTGQSWRVIKSWYTGGVLDQEFRRCFADGLSQSSVSSVVLACSAGVFWVGKT